MPGIERTLSRARSAASALSTARPLPLLAGLCCVQVALGAWLAFHEPHNGWLWYSGGDATEYWTAAWSLAHGMIPQTIIGYGVPVLYAWLPLVTGTTLISGIAWVVVLQALVLAPLALVLFWAVADRLFGRLFAWWAAGLWVLAPLLMLWGFRPDYRTEFTQLFLIPHWYGYTNMADLLSLVAVLATTWATLRLLETQAVEDAVLVGLFLGITIGLKPANGFFLPALLVLLAGVRRIRPLAAAAAAVAPSLLTLALWKREGLGMLPLTSYRPVHEAAGPVVGVASTSKYVQFDWSHLHHELLDLREVFWNMRLLQFLAVAGILAVLRRSPWKGAFVAVWFVAYCLVKGSSARAEIVTLNYWRFVEPGLPALVLMTASLVFLVPRGRRAFATPQAASPIRGGRRTLGAAVALLAVVPLAFVLVASPAASPHYARIDALANDAPLSDALAATTAVVPGGVRLTWRRPSIHGTRTYFVIYRSSTFDGCDVPPTGAKECSLHMGPVGMTRDTTFLDKASGRQWYRVAMMANYRDALDGSDLMLIGPATAARPAAR